MKVILTDDYNIEVGGDKFIYLQYDDFEELHFILELLNSIPTLKTAVINSVDIEGLFLDFRAHFTEIDAAGGVVVNPLEEVLLIHRRGKWDLPKGKVDPGESTGDAARREVSEECGITVSEPGEFLMDTYHVYVENDDRILKKTQWFSMKAPRTALVPQTEEDIDKAEWFPISRLDIDGMDTYGNIQKVLKARFGSVNY